MTKAETILAVEKVTKTFGKGASLTKAVDNLSFKVKKGEFLAIMGASGSGKSTTLNLISTIDRPTEGKILVDDTDITKLKGEKLNAFRRESLGFIFQDFNLLDQFTNKDNIFLPLVLSEVPVKEMKDRLSNVQDHLGIKELLNKYPYEISGGQKQRVAIARAVITKPSLLLADEPTGALDSASSEMILNLFDNINRNGQTILMVTHSLRAASYAKRVLFIKDGIVYHELYRGTNENQADFMERIHQAQLVLSKRGED